MAKCPKLTLQQSLGHLTPRFLNPQLCTWHQTRNRLRQVSTSRVDASACRAASSTCASDAPSRSKTKSPVEGAEVVWACVGYVQRMTHNLAFRKKLRSNIFPPGRGVDITSRLLKIEFKPLNQAAATSRASREKFKILYSLSSGLLLFLKLSSFFERFTPCFSLLWSWSKFFSLFRAVRSCSESLKFLSNGLLLVFNASNLFRIL